MTSGGGRYEFTERRLDMGPVGGRSSGRPLARLLFRYRGARLAGFR
jgi:hypothetical protein